MGRLIRADFHVHTCHSECAERAATAANVVRAAREAGLETVGITDHVITGEDVGRPRRVREELGEGVEGVRVCVGCEAEMQARDEPSISREFAAELDFTVFAASHLHNIGADVLYGLAPGEMTRFMLDLMMGAIETGYADIIAHPLHAPLCPYTFGEVVGAVERDELARTAEAAARAGVAMECNPAFVREAPEAVGWLFRVFLEAGCKVAIGSDAHHPNDVGCRGPRYAGEEELRELGIGEECLWRIEERVGGGPRREGRRRDSSC